MSVYCKHRKNPADAACDHCQFKHDEREWITTFASEPFKRYRAWVQTNCVLDLRTKALNLYIEDCKRYIKRLALAPLWKKAAKAYRMDARHWQSTARRQNDRYYKLRNEVIRRTENYESIIAAAKAKEDHAL